MQDGLTSTAESGIAGDDLSAVLRQTIDVADRLQRTHEALQGEVTRLRHELEVKDRELQLRRRLAALGELVAGVAHEVRNPLGAIQLYSDLLRSQCRERNFDPALRLIDKIEAGIQAIDAVVEDTLALAPRDRQLQRCVLRSIFERAADGAQRVAGPRDIRLDLPPIDGDLAVLADETGLTRVIANLLVNAAEASQPGQVVRVGVSAPDEEVVRVRIEDDGPGIPEAVMDRIFEPFFTTKKNGTGLGLTIAFRLVEAYGGRLTAANRPAGGAVFELCLQPALVADPCVGADAPAGHVSAA